MFLKPPLCSRSACRGSPIHFPIPSPSPTDTDSFRIEADRRRGSKHLTMTTIPSFSLSLKRGRDCQRAVVYTIYHVTSELGWCENQMRQHSSTKRTTSEQTFVMFIYFSPPSFALDEASVVRHLPLPRFVLVYTLFFFDLFCRYPLLSFLQLQVVTSCLAPRPQQEVSPLSDRCAPLLTPVSTNHKGAYVKTFPTQKK